MMKCNLHKAFYVIFGILFILLGTLDAQQNARFVSYGTTDGLPDNTIKQVVQDAKGFIWVATSVGLCRFDGYNFKTFYYNQHDINSISSTSILSLYLDVYDQLWIGTFEGLNRFDPIKERFIHYRHEPDNANSLSSNEIRSITGDSEGNLWIGTYSHGLNYFDVKTNTIIRYRAENQQANKLRSDKVRTLCLDSRGNLWIGHSKKGISILNIQTKKFIYLQHDSKQNNSLSENRINTIFESSDSIIWIGTYTKGLNAYNYQTGNFTRYYNGKNIISTRPKAVKAIIEDVKGNLWMASWGDGVFILNRKNNTFTNYKKNLDSPFSLSDNRALSIFEDRTGQIWIGTESGLNRFDPSTSVFNHIRYQKGDPNSLSDNNVYSLLPANNGDLWVGTYNGGVNRIDPKTNTFHHYKTSNAPNSLTSKSVWDMLQDQEERIWLGCSGGLCLYNPDTDDFTRFLNTADRLKSQTILCLTQTKDRQLWMGTWGTGLVSYLPETDDYQVYTHKPSNPNSISSNSVRTIFEDSQEQMWVGTYNGLNLFNPKTKTFKRFNYHPTNPNSVSSQSISCIFEDASQRIWIGTSEGLNLYQPQSQSFQRFPNLGKANTVEVKAILEDEQHYLWLSTSIGICKFNPENNLTTWFDVQDGLQSMEFTTGAAATGKDGSFHFGGTNGFNSFLPNNIKTNTHRPPAVITKFLLFNKTLAISDSSALKADLNYSPEIRLNHDQNIFAFDFSALNYRQAKKNSYKYQLEGIDDYWVLANHLYRRATYTRIKPGTYTFRLKVANDDGLWNDDGLAIKVVISPPWWQTWWARILWVILPITLILLLYQARISSLKQQKRLLEQQVEARTTEITESNKLLEVQKEEIQAQASNLLQANEEIISQKENIEEAYQNVQLLSEIGKDVTANLSLSMIVNTAYTSISQLMDVTEFGVGLIDHQAQELIFKDYIYQNQRLPEVRVDLTNVHRLAVHCVLHDQDILLGDIETQYSKYIPKLEGYNKGDLLNSLLCIPLSQDGKVNGVISVQSLKTNAFTSIHLNMLRNIAIYLNIALENANAYTKIEEQKNKLVELDQFKEGLTGMIVHDLKNPLNAIINASDQEPELSLKKAKQAGSQMLNMVLNILDVSKYEHNQMVVDCSNYPIHTLSQNAINAVSFLAKPKNISIRNQLSFNLIVKADKEIIERVFVNLLTNAIKYTPNNGRITISQLSSNSDTPNTKFLTIQVNDTGAGIEESALSKVFDKFSQVQAKKSGKVRSTGLGLTFCKMAITAHGGSIGVTSKMGKGSTFWFTLEQLHSHEVEQIETQIEPEKVNYFFLEEDIKLLQVYIPQLKKCKIYQFSKINKILQELNDHNSVALKKWTIEMRTYLLVMNEEKYHQLLDTSL